MSLVASFLLLLFVLFLLLTLCGNALFWYETLNQPETRIPALRPGLWACLRHYALSLFSYALCIGLSPFAFFARRVPTRPENSLPPVILIHGVHNNASSWLFLIRILERAGYPLSTFSYASFLTPLERIVENLDAHVRRVEEVSGGKKPLLLCHSLGGLLSRRWLMEAGHAARIGGVLTLGTPHGGSKLAVFAPGALAQSIRPAGSLVNLLREAAPLKGPVCVSLVSPEDEAVLPAAALVPPPGWHLRLTPPTPHFLLLFHAPIAALVLEELKKMPAGEEGEPQP